MIGVTGESGPEEQAEGIFRFVCSQEKQSCPFSHRHPLAVPIERSAAFHINELQGMKSKIGEATERIHSAGENTLDLSSAQHFQSHTQGNSTGGTGCGDGKCRTGTVHFPGERGGNGM
jgi:hypothetical protein